MVHNRISRPDIEKLLALSVPDRPGAAKYSEALLSCLVTRKPASVAVCKSYHDALLFIYVHAGNKRIQRLAGKGLSQVKEYVASVMNSARHNDQRSLSGSGIAGSMITCQFSLPITQWLLRKFRGDINFDSANGDAVTGGAILHRLFPRIEYYYTTQGNIPLSKRINSLTGKQQTLQKLVQAFEQGVSDDSLREILFDNMQVFTSWKLNDELFNRSFIKGVSLPVFYHDKIIKKVDLAGVLKKELPERIRLSKPQSIHLVDTAKASLAFYSRETEPITLASPHDVKLFSCGRGLAIALYSIKPGRRLSLESYIGYMVYKNNVPVAYGGGWIFADRCKIGLNVYPPFRKGESAVLFAEVLRLYQRLYKIQRFVVKPYQFGKGNKEGLQSAAFWFYYKLGFRPQDENMAALAEAEYKSGRRSTLELLKQFTTSSLELSLKPLLPKDIDPEHISRMISKKILQKFYGDRTLALQECAARLKEELQLKDSLAYEPHFSDLSLLVILATDIDSWTAGDKIKILQLLKAKMHSDDLYIRRLRQTRKLLFSIYRSVQSA